MTDLEIGYSARNADEWDRLVVALGAFRRIDVEHHHFDRARQIQRELAAEGLEGRKVPDLLIAAVAEATSLTVLHYDADFDHIAATDAMDRRARIDRPTELVAPWTDARPRPREVTQACPRARLGGVLPIVGIRPLSGRTGTTLLMNLLGTSPAIAFDRRYPAEYRIASYLVRMSQHMTEPFLETEHVGVTDFFYGPQPAWGPLPFRSDALDVDTWRAGLLRAMWSSASDGLLAERPNARWYAEKLAVDEEPLREAGVEVLTIDLVRDPRDVLASRRAFLTGGTEHWARDAQNVATEFTQRLDELDACPADMRLNYEDLACDLERTAHRLADRLAVELDPSDVDRPAHHVTTMSARASVGRWRSDLDPAEAATLAPIAERLGY